MNVLLSILFFSASFATSPAVAGESVRLYQAFAATLCSEPEVCEVADQFYEPFTIEIMGDGDVLEGEKTFTFPMDSLTARVQVLVEKSGGLYKIRVLISDSTVEDQLKGDYSTYVSKLSELNSITLSAHALKEASDNSARLDARYTFMLSASAEELDRASTK